MKDESIDAVELLVAQHRALERLLHQIKETDDTDKRSKLFAQAADQLMVHIKAEEEIFYPAVNATRTEDDLLESLEEHLSLKRLLADMLALDAEDKLFEPKFKVLKEQTEHHHKEEEEHLFPAVTQMIGLQQRQSLGHDMLALQHQLREADKPREVVVKEIGAAASLE